LVGKALTSKYGVPVNFSLAGSYAGALLAKHMRGMDLCYNDVDVFVMADQIPKDMRESMKVDEDYLARSTKFTILDVSYMDEVFPGKDIQLNVILMMPKAPSKEIGRQLWTARANAEVSNGLAPPGISGCRSHSAPGVVTILDMHLAALVESFDINAVQAGVNCYWCPCCQLWGLKAASWQFTSAFVDFCRFKTLRIVVDNAARSPANSIIRLAYKSHQLSLNMELPSPSEVHEIMAGTLHCSSAYLKWQRLPDSIKKLPHFQGVTFFGPFHAIKDPEATLADDNHREFYYIGESLLGRDENGLDTNEHGSTAKGFEWFANCRSGAVGIKDPLSRRHFILRKS
jgi:hypothetical protein